MITFTIPSWLVWLIVIAFLMQWGLNVVVAFYKKKCAAAWEQLDQATKLALGGKISPDNWRGK